MLPGLEGLLPVEASPPSMLPVGCGVRRLLKQRRILFPGRVEDRVTKVVREAPERHPELKWVQVARPGIGP